MKFPPNEYTKHLPYGLWFDPETREEHLFNRKYRRIASRSVDRPRRVSFTGARKHISCPTEVWFHNDGYENNPGLSWDALRRCETILSRFALGYDVRGFVITGDVSRHPVEGAAYTSDELEPLRVAQFG